MDRLDQQKPEPLAIGRTAVDRISPQQLAAAVRVMQYRLAKIVPSNLPVDALEHEIAARAQTGLRVRDE
jgi:hypothetical protein